MKIKLLINTALFALLLILSSNVYSQSNGWNLVNSESGIEVYSQRVSCDVQSNGKPFDYLVFKVVNTTSTISTFNLKFEIYFEEGCNGCEGSGETVTTLTLNPNESREGSCANLENKLSYFIYNPNFSGSWIYTNSKVLIEPIQ